VEKFAREKALRDGQPEPDSSAGVSSVPAPVPAAPVGGIAGKDFKETRLQIRMGSGGQPYTTSLPSNASGFCFSSFIMLEADSFILALREVTEFLAGQTLSIDVETVSFVQHFPRQCSCFFMCAWLLTASLFFIILQKNFLSR
jgi:hypothetical protein